MATTYQGSIGIQLVGLLQKTLDIGSARLDVNYSKKFNIANGTGADQANMIWTDTRTINASSSDDLDLYGGLTNAFGDAINFANVKGIFIFAAAANTNDVVVGNDGVAPIDFGATANVVNVKPGGMFCLYDPAANGYTITNTSADVLQIANSSSGTAVTYDIIVFGEV